MMSTRRAFIKKGGLTAGGLATVTALGAGILPDKGKNSAQSGRNASHKDHRDVH